MEKSYRRLGLAAARGVLLVSLRPALCSWRDAALSRLLEEKGERGAVRGAWRECSVRYECAGALRLSGTAFQSEEIRHAMDGWTLDAGRRVPYARTGMTNEYKYCMSTTRTFVVELLVYFVVLAIDTRTRSYQY